MNHPWQQPIRPMDIHPDNDDHGNRYRVLFIRPTGNDGGWEVITVGGHKWTNHNSLIIPVS
jgi:hypothetical protein